MWCGDARPGLVDQFLEFPAAQRAEHNARRSQRITRQFRLHFRIHVPGNQEQIRQPVVIQIDDARTPPDVTRLDAQTSPYGYVLEISFTFVAIKDVGVVGEMRLENVQIAVEIVIADADPHPGLLHAIFI